MKVTIVSTLPLEINESKPGLIPGTFIIPPAKKDDFNILTIDDCYVIHLNPNPDMPNMSVPEPAERVAKAIVRDYRDSAQGTSSTANADGSMAIPGMFYLTGEVSKAEIKTTHKKLLDAAFKNTQAWFMNLVAAADDEWVKSKQRRMILDLARVAANNLGLEREWNYDMLSNQSMTCPFCRSNIHPESVKCANCNEVVNVAAYEKMKSGLVTK